MKLSMKQREALGCFCFACGHKYSKKAIDGGRCSGCGTMICAATQKRIEQDFKRVPDGVKTMIGRQLSKYRG